MKTAEQFLKETLAKYNAKANPMDIFSFNKTEQLLFANMMNDFAKQFCDKQIKACAKNFKENTNNHWAVSSTPNVAEKP